MKRHGTDRNGFALGSTGLTCAEAYCYATFRGVVLIE